MITYLLVYCRTIQLNHEKHAFFFAQAPYLCPSSWVAMSAVVKKDPCASFRETLVLQHAAFKYAIPAKK